MRLGHILLKPIDAGDTHEEIDGVVVCLPYGWFAFLVLREVTGPEFGQLEDLIRVSNRGITFTDCSSSQDYDYRGEMAWIEMRDREYIDSFVQRGALRDPRIMLELGRNLFARLESQLEERRTQQKR